MASAGAGNGDAGGIEAHVIGINNEGESTDEISPLLAEAGGKPAPRMSIFSISYPARKRPPKDASQKAADMEIDLLNNSILWVWNGSRYSGLLCMASSSTIYYIMEVLMDIFPVRSIPLFETIFIRCTIILILSFLWLRRTGQPFTLPTQIRKLMVIRSLTGFISLMCFIYRTWVSISLPHKALKFCYQFMISQLVNLVVNLETASVQSLPLSYAVLLNFATPIIASVGARIILQEEAGLPDAAGLACNFIGLLLIYLPTIFMRGNPIVPVETRDTMEVGASHSIYALFLGMISSVFGGISYCLIRAGAKRSDQPVYTVLSFGVLASPISAICTFTLQEFVLPNFYTILMMAILGVLAFLAEISLARGLQLVKISKVANVLFIKVFLSQLWSMTFLGMAPSFGKLIGCFLILASVSCIIYLGPEKECE